MAELLIAMKTYLINIVGTNLYKIGRSIEPEARLAQLASGQPYEYKLIAVCGTDIELKLHKHFAEYNTNSTNSREWFCFDDQVLRQVLLMYAQPELLDRRAKLQRAEPDKAEVAELICEMLGIASLSEPFKITVELKTLYANELYAKARQMFNAENAKDNRWFWQKCLGKMFGLEYKRFGKGRDYKYRIQNLASE